MVGYISWRRLSLQLGDILADAMQATATGAEKVFRLDHIFDTREIF